MQQQQQMQMQQQQQMAPASAPNASWQMTAPPQQPVLPAPAPPAYGHPPPAAGPAAGNPFDTPAAPGAMVPSATMSNPYAVPEMPPQQQPQHQNPFGAAQQPQQQNPFGAQPQQHPFPQPGFAQQQQQQAPQQQGMPAAGEDDMFGIFNSKQTPAAPDAYHPPVNEVNTEGAHLNDAISVVSRSSAQASSAYGTDHGMQGMTSRGKQLVRDNLDPEDKERALANMGAAGTDPANGAGAAEYAPPPHVSVSARYGRVIEQTTQLPNASPLPNPNMLVHSGFVLCRISFRSILLKKWKQSFWVQHGPTSLLFFRSKADFDEWINNPYLNNSQRDFLVKLHIDFLGDMTKVNVRGYQVTHVRMKAYKGRML